MERRRNLAARFLHILLGCALGAPAALAQSAPNGSEPLVVLELFTSQSCYSCPPAEKLLAEHYLGRDDVLPLELHVDYWDDLVYGLSGKWKDVWSDPEYTRRQQQYNRLIRGTGSVYTPQFVIAGAYEAAGTRKEKIDRLVGEVRGNAALAAHKISVRQDAAGRNIAAVDGPPTTGRVVGIVFEKQSETQIDGGENDGKTLSNHNVVKRISLLEPVGQNEYALGPIDPSTEGCAFILQELPVGVIRAAARCLPAAQ